MQRQENLEEETTGYGDEALSELDVLVAKEEMLVTSIINTWQEEYKDIPDKSTHSRMLSLSQILETIQSLELQTESARVFAQRFIDKATEGLDQYEKIISAKQPQPVARPEFKSDPQAKTVEQLRQDAQSILDIAESIKSLQSFQESVENASLGLLRAIQVTAYGKPVEIPADTLAANIAGLKDLKRDEAFWTCIHDGFMNGRGVEFFKQLQKYGAYKVLFPYMTDNEEEDKKNDAWFCEKLKNFDDAFSVNGKRAESLVALTALLITRELSSSTTPVEKNAMHESLKTSVPNDSKLKNFIAIYYAQKRKVQGRYTPDHFKSAAQQAGSSECSSLPAPPAVGGTPGMQRSRSADQ